MFSSCYYLNQGAVFIRHRVDAVDIQTVRESLEGDVSAEADELRAFFGRVEQIRSFGEEHLGLNLGKSYTRYLELDQDYLVMVVNATPPHSLSPYTWSYPFFGDAPYRGYYKPEHAQEEAERLSTEGYVVWLRRVNAFSSLGITSDPLISFMQDYSEFSLARLIIHEQIHATLWVDGAIQFNEELAGSLDGPGALEYLRQVYGDNSEELQQAEESMHNSALYIDDLRELAGRLNGYFGETTLDTGKNPFQPLEEYPPGFIEGRDSIIEEFKRDFAQSYDERYVGENYRSFSDFDINIAYISLFQTYSERGNLYKDLYNKLGTVGKTLATIQLALNSPSSYGIEYKRGDDPIVIIEGLLNRP